MRSPRIFTLLMAGAVAVAASLTSAQTAPRLLVLNKTDATLAIVDPATRAVLGTVPTGEGPHELAVSADGTLAFVANYGAQTPGHTISVIDLGARRELRRIEVAPLLRPHGIQVVNGRVYFTSEIARVVARYDPEADRVDWIFGTGQDTTHMLHVNSDETRIVTANIRGNSLSILERGQNPLAWNASVVAVGRGPEGFDLSPDGTQIWAANSADGTVSIVDLASKRVAATIPALTKRSNRLKFTPDGRHVLISDLDAGELVVVDVASRAVARRVPLGRSPEGILIPPGGSVAYVAVTGDNHLAVVDLRTFTVTATIAPGGGPDGMAWVQ